MHKRRTPLAVVAIAALFIVDGSGHPPGPPAASRQPLAGLPLAFVPNLGQWDVAAAFVARRGDLLARVERGALALQAERPQADGSGRGALVRLEFENCAADAAIVGEQRRPGVYNFFLGADPARWRSGVPLFGAVCYRDLYPGIDLRVREGGGAIEYDLLVAPGGDLSRFTVRCRGTEGLRLDRAGRLHARTAVGDLTMQPPTSWHLAADGREIPVASRFVLLGDDRFTLVVPDRHPGLELVIDPVVRFATFVGGSGPDWGRDVVLDRADHALVTGQMNSPNFPSTPGAYRTTRYGVDDAYVLRLTPDGKQLAFATFLGGSSGDTGWGIDVAADGTITVTGVTGSSNFPTVNAYASTLNGAQDVFVTRLTPNGATLVFSTFLGGSNREWGLKLAVDPTGATTVVGHTSSTDFPTTAGAYDRTYNGNQDGFVTRLAASGRTLVYSTYVGGAAEDQVQNLALAAGGAVLITGFTSSTNFPTTAGAYDTTHNGLRDGFAAQLHPTGSGLVWSTLLGGSDNDHARAIAVNRHGVVVVGGQTRSTDFPTTPGVHQTTHSMHDDAFLTQLVVNGSVLGYSTYLGATRVDDIEDVWIESDGVVTATGNSTGGGLAGTQGALDPTFNGAWDPFVVRMEPNGTRRYMTFFGGSNNDNFRAAALDAANVVTAVGNSGSGNFPVTAGAYDTTHNGNNDLIVARFDLLPTGVRAYGDSSPGCHGALALDVTGVPRLGNTGWAITCTNAPANSTGFLGFSNSPATAPIPFMGTRLWVDPAAPIFLVTPVPSSTAGAARVALPIPVDIRLIGFKIHAQFVWGTPTSPAPCPPIGVSASNALEVTFQR